MISFPPRYVPLRSICSNEQEIYDIFATKAGCFPSANVFECLVNASYATLQNASGEATKLVPYGTWAFLPVTDGSLIPELPSHQLLSGAVNGKYTMCGNNGQEGAPFVPQNITTEAQLMSWAFT